MRYTEGRGIKAPQWSSRELLKSSDVNFIPQSMYLLATDLLLCFATQSSVAEVLKGMKVMMDSLLTCNVTPGAAISFEGAYYVNDTFGFSPSSDDVFVVLNPTEQAITFDTGAGQGNDRIDTVEVRPTMQGWKEESRQFKDVTGNVTSVAVNTRREYGIEIQILKGTPAGSPVAPEKTAGWIKIAEVSVDDGQTAVSIDDIVTYEGSSGWTTDAGDTIQPASPPGSGSGTAFPLEAVFGYSFYRTDLDAWFKYNGTVWVEI